LADVEHGTRVSQTCLRTLPANPTRAPDKAAAGSMRIRMSQNLPMEILRVFSPSA